MKTSEILDRAADLIQEHGWRVGSGWNDGKSAGLCLEGGIEAAMGLRHYPEEGSDYKQFKNCPAYRAVEEYLGRTHEPILGLWDWNDAQDSADRVIEVLRSAAAVERAKEESLEGVDLRVKKEDAGV